MMRGVVPRFRFAEFQELLRSAAATSTECSLPMEGALCPLPSRTRRRVPPA
jgi:hypothetical protein